MMKRQILIIQSNIALNESVYKMTLSGAEEAPRAGQFIELSLDGFYLRRPFGVADFDDGVITLLYRVQGRGTGAMTELTAGASVDVLSPLGNGFDASAYKQPLLIGGGMGVAPLYYLAKTLAENGIKPTAILGYKNADEMFYQKEFERYCNVIITTDDGSCGLRGNVIDVLKSNSVSYDGYFACGPTVMLKNLQKFSVNGQMSLEARMGCGFGACMGCSIMTTVGAKRVCKEGPVFCAEEVIF